MDSPFKFLDAYEKDDKDRFFGRTREIARLYNALHASNIVMLYGASGTGKTSLINCGLANKFYDTDWLPIFIRRGDGIMGSIYRELEKVASKDSLKGIDELSEQIQTLYKEHYRPIYLIFDQFEELHVLGTQKEQKTFNKAIAKLLKAGLPCKILISIREEYIAYLSEMEKMVPSLFDNRIRIERMNDVNLYRVVSGTAKEAKIKIATPRKTVPTIIKNIRIPGFGVELAHLQIYMDKLYKKDLRRRKRKKEDRQIRFDSYLVGKGKQLEGVISDFIDEQMKVLQEELMEKGIEDTQLPWNILFELVTDDGTKLNVEVDALKGRLFQKRDIDPEITEYCVNRLNELKVIRMLPT